MAVYVDHPRPVHFRNWVSACHMYADTDAELETMAGKICLHPDWRHGDHYDLTTTPRNAAIHFGAIEITARKLARLRKTRKQTAKGK